MSPPEFSRKGNALWNCPIWNPERRGSLLFRMSRLDRHSPGCPDMGSMTFEPFLHTQIFFWNARMQHRNRCSLQHCIMFRMHPVCICRQDPKTLCNLLCMLQYRYCGECMLRRCSFHDELQCSSHIFQHTPLWFYLNRRLSSHWPWWFLDFLGLLSDW